MIWIVSIQPVLDSFVALIADHARVENSR